jgi:hypothetical protein
MALSNCRIRGMGWGKVFSALLSNWEHPTAHHHPLPAGEIKQEREGGWRATERCLLLLDVAGRNLASYGNTGLLLHWLRARVEQATSLSDVCQVGSRYGFVLSWTVFGGQMSFQDYFI